MCLEYRNHSKFNSEYKWGPFCLSLAKGRIRLITTETRKDCLALHEPWIGFKVGFLVLFPITLHARMKFVNFHWPSCPLECQGSKLSRILP